MWEEKKGYYKLSFRGEAQTLEDWYKLWIREVKERIELICFVYWELWKQRNVVIFEGQGKHMWKVVSRIVSSYNEFHKEGVPYKMRLDRQPSFFLDGPYRVF
jgi:hypothetical protein